MEQVPLHRYLLVGSGRAATHFSHYLRLLKIPHLRWSRKTQTEDDLVSLSNSAGSLVLLISDGAIESFVKERPFLANKTLVHFSGALVLPDIFGVHPLVSFGPQLYEESFYRQMAFITDLGAKNFSQLFPDLPNPNFEIAPELRARYHADCVLSGNFTAILWNKFFGELKAFGISAEAGQTYLDSVVRNIQQDPTRALTGPLARGDHETIQKNIRALEGDAFQKIYQSFVEVFRHEHS
ncbi:MAG: DUF2520 domain-containing protein [Bdellovibrionales bacterium]|nr:DUF2520 domain-containing protein [Bdellovibrionales bacterium]